MSYPTTSAIITNIAGGITSIDNTDVNTPDNELLALLNAIQTGGVGTANINTGAVTSPKLLPQTAVIAPSNANITSVVNTTDYYTTFSWTIALTANAYVDFNIMLQLLSGSSTVDHQLLFVLERETSAGSGVYTGVMNQNAGNGDPIRHCLSAFNSAAVASNASFHILDNDVKTAGTYTYRLRHRNATSTTNFTIFPTLCTVNYITYSGGTA
jgi:hypothetical protein